MQDTQARRSLKEIQRREREQLILQVAEEVLIEKGYHETSMDEIAARVGVAKGTVYLHFPSKEELVVAIFAGKMEKFLRMVEENVSSQKSVREKLEAILRFQYGDFYKQRVQLLSSMYTSADFRRLIESKQCSIKEQWEQLFASIRQLVDEGKANGEIKSTIPTNIMVGVFLSLQSPHLARHVGLEDERSVDELVNHLCEIYFDGIAVSIPQTD